MNDKWTQDYDDLEKSKKKEMGRWKEKYDSKVNEMQMREREIVEEWEKRVEAAVQEGEDQLKEEQAVNELKLNQLAKEHSFEIEKNEEKLNEKQ